MTAEEPSTATTVKAAAKQISSDAMTLFMKKICKFMNKRHFKTESSKPKRGEKKKDKKKKELKNLIAAESKAKWDDNDLDDSSSNESSELSTLCGSNMALILFSESGRAYSFGNPNTNVIFDRFMGVVPERVFDSTFHELLEAQKSPHVRYMEAQIMEAEKTLAQEQYAGKTLSLEMTEHAKEKWCEQPIEEMNSLQLKWRKREMEELKMVFEQEKELKMATENQNPLFLLAMNSQNSIYF
ncbi:agamous-like MADS-box protein AGL23 [Impatiens glandulifera]|uniref:agamous-like MADS-box protein AGL23 n=1 Tax=Impatiens glandulifera TaxID=253017 RepID=UPI001FB07FD8|nr:agamous-like MADS-box protein AGL23 [Impatiens glandulifera]